MSEINDCFDWTGSYDQVCFEINGGAAEEENAHATIVISGHSDESYNGIYTRGEDWNDSPHFVKDHFHLFYVPYAYDGGYWQLDDRDQSANEIADFYNGGFDYDELYVGDKGEISDECHEWSTGDFVCIELNAW